jgi:hypothetical protein
MDLLIENLLITQKAKDTKNIIFKYAANCSIFLEFGSRGGITGTLIMGALNSNRSRSKFRPRFICVDLMHDETIVKLEQIATENQISFQFWRGHSSQYPLHQTDGLFWDCFHSGGALYNDLIRMSPYVNKYIMIMGMETFGLQSEATVSGFDINAVAQELHVTVDEARLGMKAGVAKFLENNKDWIMADQYSELCVLERVVPINGLFRA